jgi:hypothetical protein
VIRKLLGDLIAAGVDRTDAEIRAAMMPSRWKRAAS